jgi:hypothetical protein
MRKEPDFVLLRLKFDGTCAEPRFRLIAFEIWWHMRRNQISSYCVWNVMTHAQVTRFRLTGFEMWWHMRRNHVSSYCVWNVMAHAQKPDFVLLRLKCGDTCAETRFRLTAFDMRSNQISFYCVWNVMTHAQEPDFVLLLLKCDGTCAETSFRLTAFEMWWHRAETRFRLSTKRTSLSNLAGGVSSLDYWQASCARQPAGFVLLVQACVLQSCDAYWLPTPVSCFPFTSSPVLHRVPTHFNWTLPPQEAPSDYGK